MKKTGPWYEIVTQFISVAMDTLIREAVFIN